MTISGVLSRTISGLQVSRLAVRVLISLCFTEFLINLATAHVYGGRRSVLHMKLSGINNFWEGRVCVSVIHTILMTSS